MDIPVQLGLSYHDVGATIVTTLTVNGEECISWLAGTRHVTVAHKDALEKVTKIIRALVLPYLDEYDVQIGEARLHGIDEWELGYD